MGDAGGGVHGGEQEHQKPVDRIRDVDPVDTELAHRDGYLIAGVERLKDAPLSGRAQVVDAAGAGHAVRGASSCPQSVVRNQAVQGEQQVDATSGDQVRPDREGPGAALQESQCRNRLLRRLEQRFTAHRAAPPPMSWSRLVTKTPMPVAAAALTRSAAGADSDSGRPVCPRMYDV